MDFDAALKGSPAVRAHLPDMSKELARTVHVGGAQLKLHSAVLAAGSRVWRMALSAAAGGGDARQPSSAHWRGTSSQRYTTFCASCTMLRR